MRDKKLKTIIKQELIKIGIPIHLVGFKYLTTAISFYIKHEEENITMKEIYREINKKHNVKYTNAEKDIRYIIQNFKDIKVDLEKLSNKSFIIYVSEKIIIEKAKEMEV